MNAIDANRREPTRALTDVKSEQTRMIYAAIPSSLFGVLVASLILSMALWPVVDPQIIIGWFCLTNLLSLLRYYMFRKFEQKQRGRLVDSIWAQYAGVSGRAATCIAAAATGQGHAHPANGDGRAAKAATAAAGLLRLQFVGEFAVQYPLAQQFGGFALAECGCRYSNAQRRDQPDQRLQG